MESLDAAMDTITMKFTVYWYFGTVSTKINLESPARPAEPWKIDRFDLETGCHDADLNPLEPCVVI